MDKKNISKVSSFFKREGFYVILFVCLCIIATVAVTITKNNIQSKKEPIAENKKSNVAVKTPTVADEQSVDYQNALEVKKNTTNDIQAPAPATQTKTIASVAKVFDTKFDKPVDGTLARQYTEDPVYWASTSSYRPNFGIDIKATVGKSVVAVLDGKVESINQDTEDGVEVIINHQNGLKSVYSNLDPKISVTKDQTVKKGDQIGVVGKSTLRAAYESYGDHLHFAILKGSDFVDPAKYIKY
jgi:murein DD-endopeptidase MepM/ murein hydrolase activator NlpD